MSGTCVAICSRQASATGVRRVSSITGHAAGDERLGDRDGLGDVVQDDDGDHGHAVEQ